MPFPALLRATRATALNRDPRAALTAHLQQRFAAERVVLFSSGTHALTAAIQAALADDGQGIVALPAFGCYDLATAAIAANVRVLLYDVSPETLAPEWDSFAAALAQGARAAVVTPLFGYAIDWDRASTLAHDYSVTLIEDAAQAAGGEWHNRAIGSLGELSVLSFGRGKGWTGAGGGALLLRGSEHDVRPPHGRRRDSARAFVHACAQMLLARPAVYGIPTSLSWLHLGETLYHPPVPARSISRFSAALACASASPACAARAARAERAARFTALLSGLPQVSTFRPAVAASGGYLRFPLRILSPALRERVLLEFAADGVAPSYPLPLDQLAPLHPHVANLAEPFPGAASLARELITLPTHARASTALPSRLARFLQGDRPS